MPTDPPRVSTLSRKPEYFHDEIEFLQNLFMNSDKFVFRDHVENMTAPEKPIDEPKNLKTAVISFRMPNPAAHLVRKERTGRGFFGVDEDYAFVRFPNECPELGSDEIVETIQSCLSCYNEVDDPLHFLLLNELAVSYVDSEALVDRLGRELTVSGAGSTIGILGSYHCPDSEYNVAPIVSPFMENPVVGRVRKQTPARKQHEHVRTPDGTYFGHYVTPYGRMMVWICLDMYDPNLVIKLLRNNYRLSLGRREEDHVIDVLFLPSYNYDKQQNVANIARNVSKHCRMTVFVSNDSVNLKGSGWNNSMCFHMGDTIQPETSDVHEKCNISIYRIPDWDMRREQRSKPFTDEFSSLFARILGVQESSFKPI